MRLDPFYYYYYYYYYLNKNYHFYNRRVLSIQLIITILNYITNINI